MDVKSENQGRERKKEGGRCRGFRASLDAISAVVDTREFSSRYMPAGTPRKIVCA